MVMMMMMVVVVMVMVMTMLMRMLTRATPNQTHGLVVEDKVGGVARLVQAVLEVFPYVICHRYVKRLLFDAWQIVR